jgi:hypothetical protein
LVSGSDSKTHLQLVPSFNPFFSHNNLTLVSVSVFKNLDPGSGLVMVLKNTKNQFGFQTWFQFQFGLIIETKTHNFNLPNQ